jgi:hypothetical protein
MRVIPFPVNARATRAMANIGLLGPYRLNFDEISSAIPRIAPGVYALGHKGPDGRFYIDVVGRSDKDIRGKLHSLIGSGTLFKYSFVPNMETAFHKECDLFHEFKPPGNRLHPDRLAGTNWECPRCRFFRLQGLARP